MSSAPRLISVFRTIPKELFRLYNGPSITLREWTPKRMRSYDLRPIAGRVQPKALDPDSYSSPNGASLRPNTTKLHDLVSTFRGNDMIVYAVPPETSLPEDLLLVHEHTDRYSLQAAREMTVEELNSKITAFLSKNGKMMDKSQWVAEYPTPSE